MIMRLPNQILLAGLLLSGAVAGGFMVETLFDREPAALVPGSTAPNEMVDAIKKLAPAARSDLVSSQIARLTSEPLDIEAINNIAILESLGDHPEKSESVVVAAASRSLRDAQSQLSAVNILLNKRQYKQALFHIDGLLRSKPKLEEQLFKVMAQLQQDPEGRASVAALLKDEPPWRGKYFRNLLANDASGQSAFQLFAAIRKAGGNISDEELSYYIGVQIGKKNYDLAYFTWLDSLDEAELRSASFIFDGKFDLQPHNQFFDWTFYGYANAEIGVVADPDGSSNRVLRVGFLGGRDAFGHVRQYLKLAPGEYDFKGRWQARNFQSPSGLRWQLYCVDGPVIPSASKVLAANEDWEPFGFAITIPSDKCETQMLQLQSSSSAVLDQRFDGQIFFDDLDLTPSTLGDVKKSD